MAYSKVRLTLVGCRPTLEYVVTVVAMDSRVQSCLESVAAPTPATILAQNRHIITSYYLIYIQYILLEV